MVLNRGSISRRTVTGSSYLQHAPAEEQHAEAASEQQPEEQSLQAQESPQQHAELEHEQSVQEQPWQEQPPEQQEHEQSSQVHAPPVQQAQPGAQDAQHAPPSTLVSAEAGMKMDAAFIAKTANEEAMDNMETLQLQRHANAAGCVWKSGLRSA